MRYDEILAHRAQSCTLQYQTADGGDEAATTAATLAEVSDLVASAGFERFTLLFRVPQLGAGQQGTYAVAFADGVNWEVFLVPVRREGADVLYEACFNCQATIAVA
ncbi:MAG: hypothetical protein ABIW82_09005 [Dokdonella sp.]